MSTAAYRSRPRRRSRADRDQLAAEALARIQSSDSTANFDAIYAGFEAKGISHADILPRENVLTFTAWRAKGRTVRRGEHGVKIDAWAEFETDEIDATTGQPRKGRRRFTSTVFHVSQTADISTDGRQKSHESHFGDTGQNGYSVVENGRDASNERTEVRTGSDPGRQSATIAATIRAKADGLTAKMDHATRPMTQNPTRKRNRQYASRLIEGERLTRTQLAMRALADVYQEGNVPPVLRTIRHYVRECYEMVSTRSGSHGYYDCHDTGEWQNTNPQAVALRQLAGLQKDETNSAKLMERQAALEGIPGFFPTPSTLADRVVELADIQDGDEILEPSAGSGSLADAVRRRAPDRTVLSIVEINHRLCDVLKAKGYEPLCADFLKVRGEVDRIVMNPPFEHGQDAEHVMHAYSLLRPGGRLVAIMSEGPFFREDAKSIRFRGWVGQVGATLKPLSEDSFAGCEALRQTGVRTRLAIVDKLNSNF